MSADELDTWLRARLSDRYARLTWQKRGAVEVAVVALYDEGRLVALGYGANRAAATADAFTLRATIPSALALSTTQETNDHDQH